MDCELWIEINEDKNGGRKKKVGMVGNWYSVMLKLKGKKKRNIKKN